MKTVELQYVGVQPFSSSKERDTLVRDLKNEFNNKVRIKVRHNENLIFYEHIANVKDI